MNTFNSIAGRTALVTGSGRNIGRAIAIALAQNGANVIVNGHSDNISVDQTVNIINSLGAKSIGIMADVSNTNEVQRLTQTAIQNFGSIDILVSNVGIRKMRPFLEISDAEWSDVLATNLSPAFYLSREIIPLMQKNNWGRIIFISGIDGFWGHIVHRAHNVTCKAGLHGLAKALAREFGPDGITSNTVVPGAIDTERDWSQYAHLPSKENIEKEIPLHRFGSPDEVASACVYLCTGGSFINGQAIHVNGGQYMY